MVKGFKQFTLRGNVLDMAVGAVIGVAFVTTVSAFTKDLLTPLIAALVGKPNFLSAVTTVNDSALKFVDFINALLSFLLVAAAVYFLAVRPVNVPKAETRREPTPAPKRYGVVWEERLTRSGMPGEDSGWKWLHSKGVKSIVTFCPDVNYSELGFEHVLRVPMSGNPPGDPPSDQQAEDFLQFIRDPQNAPVHMHCASGRDRTGMMAALARYAIDGWPMERALEEARLYRHGKDLPEKRVTWLRDWASRNKPGSYRPRSNEDRGGTRLA